MQRALKLAHHGRFTASPNPRVGCLIVRPASGGNPESRIIGEGFHRRKGLPHAEREALEACSEDPSGATLYVTLEPCCHHGATPPCTEAILEAGISRVVAAVLDPFPEVQGKGVETLRRNGVQVDVGLLEQEAQFENRFFFHFQTHKKPWVILKAAMSLDGKLAAKTGDSKWITGEEAREHVHETRAEVDGILTGIGTVVADDPLLTARTRKAPADFRPPVRIVLDPQLKIPRTAQLLRTFDQAPLWIFCHTSASDFDIQELTFLKASVTAVEGGRSALDLDEVLQTLAASGIQSLLIEGGPAVHTAFLEKRLVNEIMIYIAPKLIGGKDAPNFFMGDGVSSMNECLRIIPIERIPLGDDTLIHGLLAH
ncbi:MAG: bifunctional diaminohydroxyphosphoribosylaminopyrimidine deaminase/5-amino-6-(5-phosphoribosylamino)uracil reductase RibD [Candidatus Omnitrophica bacterium]|nr:bifunctional diaminohydroxyphosphoribosylaminopyrimidine deaminase/5-amino-6-(5-phosphoribosylamino)uracil reductase RibD [Candidatus Omnitrophota bacterium]